MDLLKIDFLQNQAVLLVVLVSNYPRMLSHVYPHNWKLTNQDYARFYSASRNPALADFVECSSKLMAVTDNNLITRTLDLIQKRPSDRTWAELVRFCALSAALDRSDLPTVKLCWDAAVAEKPVDQLFDIESVELWSLLVAGLGPDFIPDWGETQLTAKTNVEQAFHFQKKLTKISGPHLVVGRVIYLGRPEIIQWLIGEITRLSVKIDLMQCINVAIECGDFPTVLLLDRAIRQALYSPEDQFALVGPQTVPSLTPRIVDDRDCILLSGTHTHPALLPSRCTH